MVVSVCASADPLAESVAAILRQRFEDFELLLVDSCGESVTPPFPDERVRVLLPKRRGWAAALNLALRHSRAPFAAFVGKGERWGEDTLCRHVEHLRRNPSLGVSLTRVSGLSGELASRAEGGRALSPAALLVEAPRWHGASAVVRRAALDATAFYDWRRVYPEPSYFDEALPACSTLDCLWRIALATRWEIALLPGAAGSEVAQVHAHGPERLVAGWRQALARARATAPDLVAHVEREATAHWLRYVARSAADARDVANARALLRESLRLAPVLALRYPTETLRMAAAMALRIGMGSRVETEPSVVV